MHLDVQVVLVSQVFDPVDFGIGVRVDDDIEMLCSRADRLSPGGRIGASKKIGGQ